MLKILQGRLQQYLNSELPDVQAGFRKGRGTRDQIDNVHRIIEKAREFQKIIYFCFIDCTKAFDYVAHNKLKYLKRWDCQTTLPASWEICMQVKKQQLELDMEKQTGSQVGKEYVKAIYCHPTCLTYMQIKYVMRITGLAGIKLAGRNINNLRNADDTTLMAESKEEKKRHIHLNAEFQRIAWRDLKKTVENS